MLYRRLGSSGLRSSVLSLGNAAIHLVDRDKAVAIFRRALDAGITHFDTAEAYGACHGQAETALGEVLKAIGIGREKYILATKAFTYGWSDPPGAPHEVRSLNRKYLLHAIDRSLTRLGTDHVDIYQCHQMADDTPVEEIVDAMEDIVRSGKARYWAVSNWDAQTVAGACRHAERYGRHAPILNQIEYNVLFRSEVTERKEVMREHGVGVSAWSPLAGGLLTGKYIGGVPEGSRAELVPTLPSRDRLIDEERNELVRKLSEVAADIGCSVAQLALAWCLVEPMVSTVVMGASSVEQLDANLGAVDAIERLTSDVLQRIAGIVGAHDMSNVPVEMRNG